LHVVITTLSFYAACVAFKLRFLKNNNVNFNYVACFAIIVIAFFVYKYLKASGESNEYNQGLSEEAEKILLKSLGESNISNLSDLVNDLLKKLEDPDKFIKAQKEKKRKGHPSYKRWLWQAIIVISGAFISIVLINGLIIGVFFILFTSYMIANCVKGS